jgi:hypothetical protein
MASSICRGVRHYDIYELLQRDDVQERIGTEPYIKHKHDRFSNADNQNVTENQAFSLGDAETRAQYADAYERSRAFEGRPSLVEILAEIQT